MSTTPNLGITLIDTAQAQKEVTANTAFTALDAAVCGLTTLGLTTSPMILTSAQAQQAAALRFSGSHPGGSFVIQVPAAKKSWMVQNTTGGTLTFKTASGTGADVAAAGTALIYCDGADCYVIASGGASAVPYDLTLFFPGKPAASGLVLRFVATRAITVPSALTGSQARAGTAATGAASFTILKNATTIGTLDFAAGASSGTFTLGGGASLAAGDVLSIQAPGTQDATLADLAVTLALFR